MEKDLDETSLYDHRLNDQLSVIESVTPFIHTSATLLHTDIHNQACGGHFNITHLG